MTLFETTLPIGWTWKTLSTDFRVTKKPREIDYRHLERIPFVPMDAVPLGGREEVRVDWRAPSEVRSGTYFERGDVLLSKITPSFENGKQGLAASFPSAFGVGSTEIIPLQSHSASADNRFLFFYLLHPEVRASLVSRMEGSTGRQRVPEGAVRELMYPAAPMGEQRRIAAILWKVQRTIEVQEKLVATVRELKQAAMRQLFTSGLRGEAQKETEIGLVPERWEVLPFASVREFLQYGTSSKCDYSSDGSAVLRIPNVLAGRIDPSDLKRCVLPEREVAQWLLSDGDVLFIRTNGVRDRVGSCAVYHGEPENALFASYLIRARLHGHVLNPDFFQYFAGSEAGIAQLGGRASPAADGKFNINTRAIDSLLVPVPQTLAEQHEIATALQTIDRKLAHHARKRDTMQELFKSLLHELMTGRIRVHDLDIDTTALIGEPTGGEDK